MAELIFSALRLLGAMWMVATFIVVVGSFVRLVGEGKDLVATFLLMQMSLQIREMSTDYQITL